MYLEKGVHLKNKLNLLIQGYSGLILLLAPRSLNACYYLYDYHYNSIATWSILSWSVFFLLRKIFSSGVNLLIFLRSSECCFKYYEFGVFSFIFYCLT